MAATKQYPENRSLRARLECLIESHTRLRLMLMNVQDLGLFTSTKAQEALASALAQADIASRALTGDDN